MKNFDFSLIERKNYNKNFKKKINFYIREYTVLIKEFIDYFEKYVIYGNYKKYHIILKGIKSITHIFLIILLYTKNLSLTLYHCKKSFLYYVEFISQIGDEGNSYLQLNTKDAILFIYKKSIFDVNNTFKQEMEINTSDQELLDDIKKFTQIFDFIYFYAIDNIISNKNEKKEKINNEIKKILDLVNKKRTNDICLFDKILVLLEEINIKKISNVNYFDKIKSILKKKKFNNLTKEEFVLFIKNCKKKNEGLNFLQMLDKITKL